MLTFTVEPRKVWVPYGGKNVLTHPITHLPKSILVAQGTGEFFLQYWEEGERRGDKKQRRWRKYRDVWSLHRGLKLAHYGTIVRRLPTLEELRSLCGGANITLSAGRVAPEALAQVKTDLLRVLDTLRQPRTHALKDVVVQVELVVPLRDAKGRLNTGALAARLVPVKNRLFVERVSDIAEWLGYYAHWEQDVAVLLQLAGGFLPTLEREINRAVSRLADLTDASATLLSVTHELWPHADFVKQLVPFGGWTNWARACSADFRATINALYANDRDVALAALRRLATAIRLKRLQADISDLLLEIQMDALNGDLQVDRYLRRLEDLLSRLATLDDAHLRTPVVPTLAEKFRATIATLGSKEPDRTRVRKSRDHLRVACAAL
ncbi:MAG: hypothetical protein G01um101431_1170 [Parcubacteria group bacterium Gr01-1014_31]|nr:MAG: hypothetical protein G01um101431_1170 [Parcubacteria group bacterium Gr01-1014_31]